MRTLLAVALLVLVALGAALLAGAGDPSGGDRPGEPAEVRQGASEAQPPARSRDAGEPGRETPPREAPAEPGRPETGERAPRPGELRLPDRPECRVPDSFDVPGCSGHP